MRATHTEVPQHHIDVVNPSELGVWAINWFQPLGPREICNGRATNIS